MIKSSKIIICILSVSVFLAGCCNQYLLDSEQVTPIPTEAYITNKIENTPNTNIGNFEIFELFGDSELGIAVSREIGGKDIVTKDDLDAIIDLNMTFKLGELRGISYLTSLKKLEVSISNFDNCENTSEIMGELSSLKNLTEIEISCWDFSSENKLVSELVKAIENIETLEKISFVNWQIIDTELLVNFDSVKSIVISIPDTCVESIDLSGLMFMDNLKSLNVQATEVVQDLIGIEKLTNLRKLELFSNDIRDLTSISSLVGLEYLDLCGNCNLPTSEYIKLSNLKNLRVLEIGVREDNNILIDLTFLDELDMLEELLVTGSYIEGISRIASLSALRRLEIYYYKSEDLSFLKGLDKLEYISLRDTSLSDISELLELPSLKTLNISGTAIENDSVSAVINELKEKGVEIIY